MTVAESHNDPALASKIMPNALGIIKTAVHVPNPIALDDLIGRTTRDL